MEHTRRDRLPMKSSDEKSHGVKMRRSGPHGRPIWPPNEPLCVAERVQTTGLSVTKTRKFFVKKKKSGMPLRPNLDLVGHKMDKMAKEAAETEEYFAGTRTISFRYKDKKKTEQTRPL